VDDKGVGVNRPRRHLGGGGKNVDDKGVSDISRLLGAVKLQSAPGANNPHYVTV